MMKNMIAVAMILGLMLAGCSTPAGKTVVEPGEEFSLAIGQSASLKGENLEITFLDVTEDSRCPSGAVCVWEGRATSSVRISGKQGAQDVGLPEPGLSQSPYQQTIGGYTFIYHLQPYPELDKQITRDQYRLLLSISRAK